MRLALLLLLLPAVALAQPVQQQSTITTTTCLGTGTLQSQETGCIVAFLPQTTGSIGVEIGTGWLGTLLAEGMTTQGNWFPLLTYASGMPVSAMRTPGLYVIDPGGAVKVRVRAGALDSGSAIVTLIGFNSPVGRAGAIVSGIDPAGGPRPFAATMQGVQVVLPVATPLNPFLPRCNAVRTTQCQP
jgi:hypothetical protein